MPALAEGDAYDAAQIASVIGLHLVTQVLDEACTIAQASQRIGWPWTCVLSLFRDARIVKLPVAVGNDKTFIVSQADDAFKDDLKVTESDAAVAQGDIAYALGDVPTSLGDITIVQAESQGGVEATMEAIKDQAQVQNLATSTPHKGETTKMKPENSFIGQGDEEFDMRQEELNNSTSIFINHLFDMSEVEKEISCDETKITIQANPKINTEMVTNLMDSLFNNVVGITSDEIIESVDCIVTDQIVEIVDLRSGQVKVEVVEIQEEENLNGQECYPYLADLAYDGDVENNVVLYVVEDEPSNEDEKEEECEEAAIVVDEIIKEDEDDGKEESCNVARYEDAYLTLNRDYEPCSEGDGDPILQDPKGLIMQDVELLSNSSVEDKLSTHCDSEERKKLAATSGVSGASGSRKSRSSLASRCRSQGARLLACLRGWWRRKTPGKRKEARPPGSVRGLCPLSPNARRRTASLLDHRNLYSPTPSRSVVWKFNTVNEAVVNSNRWKEYTFEVKPSLCEED